MQAAERPRSGDAALPSAAKSQRKVNRSPLCGTGSVSPHPPPHVTAQSLQTSAVLLFSLHGEVCRHAGSGARAGSGCSLTGALHPTPPNRGWCQGPPATQPIPLGSCAGSPKLSRCGGPAEHSPPLSKAGEVGHLLLFWGSVRLGEGCKALPVSVQGTCSFGLRKLCPSPVVSELGKRSFSPYGS